MDLNYINIRLALRTGDIKLIDEFINDKVALDKFVNGDPFVFHEILLSAICVDRTNLDLDNINEVYDGIILRLIKVSNQIHFASCHPESLLMWALKSRMSYEIIVELINAGSNVNATSKKTRMTPLMYALFAENDKKIITELLSRGANVNCRNYKGHSPLYYVVKYYYNNPDVIEMLLKAGSSIRDVDRNGKSILMVNGCNCIDGGGCTAKELIGVLLKCGIDLWHTDKFGNTVLHETYCEYIFQLAVNSGVSIETKNHHGCTPLLKELFSDCNEEKLVYLIKSGANVNCTDDKLQTVLHLLNSIRVESIHPYILNMLLYHGLYLYACDIYERTPLDIIIEKCFPCTMLNEVTLKHIILFDYNRCDIKKALNKLYNKSFLVECIREVNLMQEMFIADGVTFYEFCILKRYYKNKCVKISPIEYNYSCNEIRQLFPLYENVIIIRFKDNRLKRNKLDLRRELEKLALCVINTDETEFCDALNYDCLYHVCRYLNYKNLFNIFSAAVES